MARKSINKIHLSIEADQYSTIFGIVSSEPAYKLSVLINQTMGYSLQSTDPLVITCDNIAVRFARFTDKSQLPHYSLTLIQNRSEQQTLLRKFPNLDYILVRVADRAIQLSEDEESYSSLLRRVEYITAVFIIDKKKIETSLLETIIPGY